MDAFPNLEGLAPQNLLTAAAYFIAFSLIILRTLLQNPALSWGPSAPFYERLAFELLAAAAGIRGWLIFVDVLRPTATETALALTLAAVAAVGLWKLVSREIDARLTDLITRGWG
ncbi:MAG: hypothetical protein KF842_06715 [Caulobacter sp.]|nr:hypothetical protein [Caulobacter sp.]